MKPGKTFNMSKQTKMMLATLHGESRAIHKRYMIQAEQAAAVILKSRAPRQQETTNE